MVWNQPMNAILYFDVEVEQDSNESMTSTKKCGSFSFLVNKHERIWYNCFCQQENILTINWSLKFGDDDDLHLVDQERLWASDEVDMLHPSTWRR